MSIGSGNGLAPKPNPVDWRIHVARGVGVLNEHFCVLIQISSKFVPKGPNDNKWALVQVTAWHRSRIQLTDAYMLHGGWGVGGGGWGVVGGWWGMGGDGLWRIKSSLTHQKRMWLGSHAGLHTNWTHDERIRYPRHYCSHLQNHIDGFVQDCSSPGVLAMELLQSFCKPSI